MKPETSIAPNSKVTLGFEKFRAYQRALEFYSFVQPLFENTPPGNSAIIDQFRRAALSIVLNIAEGSGKGAGKDRNRFYRVAIGSAMEVGALLDVCSLLKLTSSEEIERGKDILSHIIGILTSVINGKD